MNSSRNYLVIFLALTTLGGAVLAWNQHLEIIKLNAALLEQDLDAQRHQHEFEDKLSAAQAASKKAAKNNDEAQSNDPRPRGRFATMQAMMNDPDFVKLMALQQKARLDGTYAPLFKQLVQQLNLSPAQLAAFQNLLVQKQNAARDVVTVARDQGLDPRADRGEINQLVDQSNAEIDNQIQTTLGPDAYAQYQGYEQTLPERNTVNQIQQNLSYTSTPLTDAQEQQLINLLAANAPKNNSNPTSYRTLFGGGSVNTPIPDAVMPQIVQQLGLTSSQASSIGGMLPVINAPHEISTKYGPGAAQAGR